MKKYSMISYLAVLFGLSTFLFFLPYVQTGGFVNILLGLNVIAVVLSVIGLFKKNEKKALAGLSLFFSLWLPITILYMILALG
ncbi:hypothetical protein ACFSMW_19855 [Virgibacillus halophilus]|uniref:hypothetical protein n=1 Tax=Tigheibacillus halophilus TaxID=361280 RepID=UPI00362A036E